MGGELTISWNSCDAKQWDAFYAQSPYPTAFQQSYAYGEAVKALGASVTRAVLYHDGTPIALWQATQKRLFRLLPLTLGMRGPVWLTALSNEEKYACLQQLKKACKGFTLLMPEEQTGFAPKKLWRVMTGYSTVMLNLSSPIDVLEKAMNGKWRNRLRAAEKASLRIDSIGKNAEQYVWLLEEEVKQSKRVGYAALSPMAVPLYQLNAGKDALLGLQAWQGTERVAAMLFLLHGNTATYHIGWANEDGKKHSAHNFLLWEAMQRLKKRGIHWLDLGGVNDEDGAGIAHFKRGTGGDLLTLCGTYF